MKAEEIEHLCVMIHMSADRAHDDAMNEIGYVNRLNKLADQGGFISLGSLEEMQLYRSVEYLRKAADTIDNVRTALLMNDKPDTFIENIQARMQAPLTAEEKAINFYRQTNG